MSSLIGLLALDRDGLSLLGFLLSALVTLIAAWVLERRGQRARLRWSLTGAGAGGMVAMFVLLVLESRVDDITNDFGNYLLARGLPVFVYTWSGLYLVSGWLIAGMAAGAGLGWWLKREKAK